MLIKVNQFVKEIEVDDLIDVDIERGNEMRGTIKKLTFKLTDQLSLILQNENINDLVRKEFIEMKQMVKEKKLKESGTIDLSAFR